MMGKIREMRLRDKYEIGKLKGENMRLEAEKARALDLLAQWVRESNAGGTSLHIQTCDFLARMERGAK